MKVGWAYMGLAAMLILLGVYLSFARGGVIGDLLIASSLISIYLGSNALADARHEREAAKAAGPDAESTERTE